jgi:cation diffusion facilitator CzcD-associated flavoprotein CzcO
VARHFTPTYGPWDQRVCLTPGGDLFRAIASGGADVVTDTITGFTEHGVRVASGDEVVADVVIAATGLEVLALGDVEVVVDGERMAAGERLVYKGVMLSDVPNLAYLFGYSNASWTLKVDLACAWVCRVLAFMQTRGYRKAVARTTTPMSTRPMLDLAAGYIRRADGRLPRQGTGVWSVSTSYRADVRRLCDEPVDDGVLRFSRCAR